MDLSDSQAQNKLILLFIFDKMDFPITDNNIQDIASQSNSWIPWMECKEATGQLLEAGFIHQTFREKKLYYSVTPDGRLCLSHFYSQIPVSLRNEITEYVKDNRMSVKRKQEYFRSYNRNDDGTHTVYLKIVDPVKTVLELTLNVASRQTARSIYNKWEEKAGEVYSILLEQLVE
jgi:predicted transcriptional regulator